MRGLRGALGALIAVVIGVSALGSTPAHAEPRALSPWDAQLYAAAFDAVKKGDFATAEAKLAQVTDKCLVGMVEFDKLFHPTAYHASYEELVAWLEKYSDLPVAPRVRALARKRKAEMDAARAAADAAPPEPAPGSRSPLNAAASTVVRAPQAVVGRTWDAVEAAGRLLVPNEPEPPQPKAAREALNAGDLQRAYDLALQLNDNWIAGLASWRRNRFDEAFRRFEMVALDPTEDVWVRAAGGYWAARSAIAKGSPELAPDYLRIAARYPHTFYGILAEHQLGLEPSVRPGPQPYQFTGVAARPANDALNTPQMTAFIRANARAKRAVALVQVGQREDAGLELRVGMGEARDEVTRANWTSLAIGLDTSLSRQTSSTVDVSAYPIPTWAADGQTFQVDRALLFALMRRESRFNPQARSPVGAYGLMQVMPSTAAWLTGDASLRTSPQKLWDPATNMRVGQAYIAYLGQQTYIHNDIFRIVAAYNGGPQPVMVTEQRLPKDADVLLFMESIPVPQTRVYIEEVMAAYWIYRQLLGEEPRSLAAVANGARTIPMNMDYRPPAPATPLVLPQGAPPAPPAPPQDPADPERARSGG
ncbi:MAG: lytic transglycosylase domain-containing protein [Caulobacteraceae bacterium]|nr:lytic transglycosylase domain-containing protein [Caulobacteraceae bacterium]